MKPIVNPYLRKRQLIEPPVNQLGSTVHSKKIKSERDDACLTNVPVLPVVLLENHATTTTSASSQQNIVTPDPKVQKIHLTNSKIGRNVARELCSETKHSKNIHISSGSKPSTTGTKLITSLGRLRTRPGISFDWIGKQLPTANSEMGRIYFNGFKLCSKNYHVGNVVKMKTDYLNQTVRILSVFQATKSFQGNAYGDGCFWEIQKRGHPYMEVQRLDRNEPEMLADWLLDAELKLSSTKPTVKQSVKVVAVALPAVNWHKSLEAEQVYYYSKNIRTWKCGNLPCIRSTVDSDSSDDESDDATSSTVASTQDESSDESKCKTIKTSPVVVAPSPRIIVYQHFPFFDKSASRYTTSNDSLLAELGRRKWFDLKKAAESKVEADLASTHEIDIVVVDEQKGETIEGVDVETMMKPFYGDINLRTSQQRVCMELLKGRHDQSAAKPRYDVFYAAPCGFGKSLCFVAMATLFRGITLVVEPLRALINSQMKELSQRTLKVARLLSRDDVKHPRDLYGPDYLRHLANNFDPKDSLIIFSTPELLSTCSDKNGIIQELVRKRLLSLIVIDEFDYIDECHQQHRNAYTTIVPSLKHAMEGSNVPFLYLSATGSSFRIFDILFANSAIANPNTSRPIHVQTEQILPQNHIYKVERKTTLAETMQRVASILERYKKDVQEKSFAKSICFCLTPGNCDKAVNILKSLGIPAASFSGDSNRESALAGFHDGSISVLCATSALGRGVHIGVPIRFIFHIVVPASLPEYVQTTGRGGRDGKKCYCILFFRSQDFEQVKNVIRFRDVQKEDQDRCSIAISNVFKYAMEGQRCRKLMLADEAISFLRQKGAHISETFAKCTGDSECDNCMCTRSGRKIDDITHFVKYLSCFVVKAKRDKFDWETYKSATNNCKDLPAVLTTKARPNFMLQVDLHRFLQMNDQQIFLDKLANEQVGIYVRNGVMEATPTYCRRWFDFESIARSKGQLTLLNDDATEFPFLLSFESDRLGLDLQEIFKDTRPETLSSACEQLFGRTGMKYPQYLSTLRNAELNNLPLSTALVFQARLSLDGFLHLLEPQRADDKRIFRMYGSDRFLEISISKDVSNHAIKSFLSKVTTVGNRRFKFFWFKREAGIHPVLFAESGDGIDDVSVQAARERCIPIASNADLSLGKWVKRMKLNFSTTTATCKLPSNCVSVLSDFEEKGVAQIDGAGLISSMALQAVWNGYSKGKDVICRFSGFQGRLSGFKGVWILDPTLQGFQVLCRRSQLKYEVPLQCRNQYHLLHDDVHETMEVSSFCNKQGTTLNIRVIQILEHYAERANKHTALELFLMECVKQTTEEIEKIFHGSDEALYRTLHVKMNVRVEDVDSFDSQILRRMSAALVDVKDPERSRLCRRWLTKYFASIRDKAHYPIKDCIDLRLYPDHTLLLLENEAYVAIDGNELQASEIVALRSPSYFSGDMRKLKLVNRQTLLDRVNLNYNDPKLDFFNSVRHALVTSIRGDYAEASRMSGGDYDGDRAWLSWNSNLLDCLPDINAFVAEDTSILSTEISNLENRLFSDCSNADILDYMIHFRNHHVKLGYLSEMLDFCIDKYGFDDQKTKLIGRAAFMQVDMPFHPYPLDKSCTSPNRWPDWKPKKSEHYESNKILGKMYRYMNESLKSLTNGSSRLNGNAVPEKICHLLSEYDDEMIKKQVLQSLKDYIQERNSSSLKMDQEKYFDWQKNYLLHEREKFILDKKNPNKVALLDAALIYNVCFNLEQEDTSSRACEFVWGLCSNELLEIFAGENKMYVAGDAQHFALK